MDGDADNKISEGVLVVSKLLFLTGLSWLGVNMMQISLGCAWDNGLE